jgi:glycosyltransferase involved in cell wall biosynthesis
VVPDSPCRWSNLVRIAIIAPPWVAVPPLAYGGTEAVIDGLARALRTAGHDVLLFATGDSTCPVPTSWVYEAAIGVDAARPASELHHVVNAYDWIAGEADIVHDHTLVGPVYAQRFAALPVVTTNHGPFDSELGDYYRAIAGRVPIIAISQHQASMAARTAIAAVIHHGVDIERFPAGAGAGGYALFLGRMSPDKGVHTAIAVARAAGVPLKIACKMQEPAEQAYYRTVVAPLLGADVEFVGEVGGEVKLGLLANATCLLNPIAWPEPFGMVMIEAMACGTPVVATPMGAVSEIVDDGLTGFVRSTPADLAEAVLAAGQLDRLACRQVAADRFSTARMAADHVRLYESVLGPHRTTALVA